MTCEKISEGLNELPLVTVVLVCWNHRPYLEAAVRSALEQTYSRIEIIAYDNGSTDGSGEALSELSEFHGFKLIRQDNIGLVSTLNDALRRASGQYFATLATDDIWLPEKIERQVLHMQQNPSIHMLSGAMEVIDASGRSTGTIVKSAPGEKSFERLMSEGCSVHGPTVMCRTETLRALGGYDARTRIEDYAAALHFSKSGYRVVVLDEVCAKYRRHSTNWTGKNIWLDRRELGRIFHKTPQYRSYVKHNLRGYFRYLSGRDKRAAIELLLNEPIAWSWSDIGIGLFKLMVPGFILRAQTKER
jgi:alpha-1,3-rhamnosyltransferase